MYSLDQVIYFLEQRQQTEDWNIRDVAITYLKGYREVLPEYAQMKLDAVKNDPLTWDELKQMEGKPVWVEEYYPPMETGDTQGEFKKFWALVIVRPEGIYFDWVTQVQGYVYSNRREFYEDRIGDIWQAYRKERE